MKTIIAVIALLFTGITNADAQNSWKPAPGSYDLSEVAPQYLTRTEAYLGAEFDFTDKGAVVRSVAPNSPAEGQFKKGDVITVIGRFGISSKESYAKAIEGIKPGEVVKISFIRNGSAKEKKVRLEKIEVVRKAGV